MNFFLKGYSRSISWKLEFPPPSAWSGCCVEVEEAPAAEVADDDEVVDGPAEEVADEDELEVALEVLLEAVVEEAVGGAVWLGGIL